VCLLQTNIPDFRHTEMEVYRRFSDFLGLHEKLTEKHLHHGCIIPPPPEKSVIGLLKFFCITDIVLTRLVLVDLPGAYKGTINCNCSC
jgi:PX domain